MYKKQKKHFLQGLRIKLEPIPKVTITKETIFMLMWKFNISSSLSSM